MLRNSIIVSALAFVIIIQAYWIFSLTQYSAEKVGLHEKNNSARHDTLSLSPSPSHKAAHAAQPRIHIAPLQRSSSEPNKDKSVTITNTNENINTSHNTPFDLLNPYASDTDASGIFMRNLAQYIATKGGGGGRFLTDSCVQHCALRSAVQFQMPKGVRCREADASLKAKMAKLSPGRREAVWTKPRRAGKKNHFVPNADSPICTFSEYAITFYKREKFIVGEYETFGRCLGDSLVECAAPEDLMGCKGQCWNEWDVQMRFHPQDAPLIEFQRHIYNLIILPERPFRITNMYLSSAQKGETFKVDSAVQIIGYFLPNMPRPDKCNTLHCIWHRPSATNASESIHIATAQTIDVSSALCPIPPWLIDTETNTQTHLIDLRVSYDLRLLSKPFSYSLTSREGRAGNRKSAAHLSICAIVKREGKNLPEWLEYHRMMGVDSFILYDNNPVSEPDERMEQIINKASDIKRIYWPHKHAQTEALTDCMVRFGTATKWMALVDVDEFLVPNLPFSNIREALDKHYTNVPYIHSDWITFGPCVGTNRTKGDGKERLIMEICTRVTKSSSHSPKAIIQPAQAASMQGYGPHYVRLKADVNRLPRSASVYANKHFRVYHYRYRTWDEYVQRRKGSAAGRVIVWDDQRLRDQWDEGLKHSKPMDGERNRIARFVPELKRRLGM